MEDFRGLPPDGGPEAYLRYAKRWGPLGLCARHSLPCPHAEQCLPRRRGLVFSEPLGGWRDYVAQFAAALSLAAANQARKKCSREDWRLLGGQGVTWHLLAQQVLLAEALNRWLTLGSVRPRLLLAGDPVVYMESGSDCGYGSGSYPLFGTLVWQLVLVICRSDGLGRCSGCGVTYVVTGRGPRRGARTYCNLCREAGTPHRDAMRDYRGRMRTAALRDAKRDYRHRLREKAQ